MLGVCLNLYFCVLSKILIHDLSSEISDSLIVVVVSLMVCPVMTSLMCTMARVSLMFLSLTIDVFVNDISIMTVICTSVLSPFMALACFILLTMP